MVHRKHYKRISKSEFDYIKGLISQGYTLGEIRIKTGRSSSTLAFIKKANSLEGYLNHNQAYRANTLNREPGQIPLNNINQKSDIDSKLTKLDLLFDELKDQVAEVVEALVEAKVEQFKREKEQEVKDMKEVVEAAKQSSIAGILKNRFMGK